MLNRWTKPLGEQQLVSLWFVLQLFQSTQNIFVGAVVGSMDGEATAAWESPIFSPSRSEAHRWSPFSSRNGRCPICADIEDMVAAGVGVRPPPGFGGCFGSRSAPRTWQLRLLLQLYGFRIQVDTIHRCGHASCFAFLLDEAVDVSSRSSSTSTGFRRRCGSVSRRMEASFRSVCYVSHRFGGFLSTGKTRGSLFPMDRIAMVVVALRFVHRSFGSCGSWRRVLGSIHASHRARSLLLVFHPSIPCDVRRARMDAHLLHRGLGDGGHDPRTDGLTSLLYVARNHPSKPKAKPTPT